MNKDEKNILEKQIIKENNLALKKLNEHIYENRKKEFLNQNSNFSNNPAALKRLEERFDAQIETNNEMRDQIIKNHFNHGYDRISENFNKEKDGKIKKLIFDEENWQRNQWLTGATLLMVGGPAAIPRNDRS